MEALAIFAPLIASVGLNRGDALFRSDRAVLTALEGGGSFAGSLSRALGRFALALPLGNHSFRLALVGALGLSLLGFAVVRLCQQLMQRQGGHSRLDPWLACGASLAATLNVAALSESTVSGGAVWGAALGLIAIAQELQAPARGNRAAVGRGLLWGASFAESPWCGALVVFASLLMLQRLRRSELAATLAQVQKRRLRDWLRVALLLGSALATISLIWAPLLVGLSTAQLTQVAPAPLVASHFTPLSWMSRVGLLWCVGAVAAVLVGLKDRRPLAILIAALVLDWIVPSSGDFSWTTTIGHRPGRMALHLTALASVAPLGALGLRTLVETAGSVQLFGAQKLATLVSLIAVAGSLAGAEDSISTLAQTNTRSPQIWTDEALQGLPHGALVLTHSPAVGTRLLAEQALGARPDVLIVPVSELLDGKRVRSWLEREPALDLLLRDLSLSENPSERAVAKLVDARAVFVEPNPDWDERLLEHLHPGAPLCRMSSHALGRSDRLADLAAAQTPQHVIHHWIHAGLVPDDATAHIFESGLDELAAALERIDGSALRELQTQREARRDASQGNTLNGPASAEPDPSAKAAVVAHAD